MNKFFTAVAIILEHFIRNISNYLLFIGIFIVVYYIYIKHGFDSALLSVGITFIGTSIVNELNKIHKPQKRY